ncbi:DUF418 domain-containing protein [Paenibacillus soyae]|uniref:DUF418 domain-containing protein n=1 Tax=Paenibacillus soyae TaxID=2969249 RepID=A0A9X2SAW6_9BACL|nr:DUF418 domain-containing protein [Paenibacillus soyae]MCR2804127.1 DUF418 domain-containing protein [Paenibacillus soyae]
MMDRRKERQTIVDEIRGASLFGILMANMLIFQFGMWGKDELELFGLSDTEAWAHTMVKIVIEGSFMPIFAFLFGYGMYKLMEGQLARNGTYKWVLIRRFAMLIGLGTLHSLFIWEGDILMVYGLMGLLLIVFLKRKAKTVLVWGVVLLSLFGLTGLGVSGMNLEQEVMDKERTREYVLESTEIYQTGSYPDIFQFRLEDAGPIDEAPIVMIAAIVLAPILIAPMFLFGIYAAKKEWFHRPEQKRSFYRKWALLLASAGLLLKTLPYVAPDFILSGIGETAAAPLLAIGYIMGFAWLFSLGSAGVLRQGFEAVGRLSLTNYLLQSIVCTTLFYGYGFGWYGKLGVLAGIVIALTLYALQLLGSFWYVKRFRIGPVERLLRVWTYWSWRGRPKTIVREQIDLNA